MAHAEVAARPQTRHSFQRFVESLRAPELEAPLLSPKRFSEALHIDIQTLAEQARVHRNTITRAPGSRGVQDYLRESLRAIKAATDLSGDVGRALFWYRNEPLSPFEYKTAERLVSEGRTDDLLRYIASLEAGPAG